MRRARMLAVAVAVAAALSAGPGAGAQALHFCDGSPAPGQLAVEPWAAVAIDGRRAPAADLQPGTAASLQVDAQGRAVAVDASDHWVSGVVDAVLWQGRGRLFLIVDGRPYPVRRRSAVVAEGGQVIGALAQNLDLLPDNRVVALLGPDGWIGYVEVV
jgi:hypothetical protein